MLLKQETPSHFGGVENFSERWNNLREHGDVRGAEPEGGFSGKQLQGFNARRTPTPDTEEPAAMAPDKPPTGMSAEQKLQALLEEHPELREMMGGRQGGTPSTGAIGRP